MTTIGEYVNGIIEKEDAGKQGRIIEWIGRDRYEMLVKAGGEMEGSNRFVFPRSNTERLAGFYVEDGPNGPNGTLYGVDYLKTYSYYSMDDLLYWSRKHYEMISAREKSIPSLQFEEDQKKKKRRFDWLRR